MVNLEGFNDHQAANLAAVVAEVKRQGLDTRAAAICVMTVLTETGGTMYANAGDPASLLLPHDAVGEDHDSAGLFQQRTAWGSLAERMDPAASTRLFLYGGHDGQPGMTDYDWQHMPLGEVCQRVQVSAFPDRYAERALTAGAIVGAFWDYDTGGFLMALTDAQQQEIYETLHEARLIRSVHWDRIDKAAWAVLSYLVPAAVRDRDDLDSAQIIALIKALPQQTVTAIKAAL